MIHTTTTFDRRYYYNNNTKNRIRLIIDRYNHQDLLDSFYGLWFFSLLNDCKRQAELLSLIYNGRICQTDVQCRQYAFYNF